MSCLQLVWVFKYLSNVNFQPLFVTSYNYEVVYEFIV